MTIFTEDDRATLERFRVTELISRYVDALNHRDWDRYADCWTEDCIFKMTIANSAEPASGRMTTIASPISVRTDGREGILGLVRNYNTYPWLFQLPIGVLVTLEGEGRARIRHVLHVMSHALVLIGHCYDEA
ncbi:MAG TPA: nuclear transport factor 2 family protein, partial [Novosphingobium sp.]|nr:nuclear transport factor 2 family protein [Novosphingobium sp.]